MRKIIDVIREVTEYMFRHWSAVFITGMIISIGMLNPFVVEKYQSIYTYPVTKTGATVWDIVFVLMIIIVWNIDKWTKTLETKK